MAISHDGYKAGHLCDQPDFYDLFCGGCQVNELFVMDKFC